MTDSMQTAAAPDTTTSAAAAVQSDASTDATVDTSAATAESIAATTEDAGQPQGAPEQYADFTVPDGLEIDADVLTDFKGIAKDLGITQEAAQKLVDLQAGLMQKATQAAQQALTDQAQQWADTIKADKELGGERFAQTVETAAKAIEKFGSPELRTLLNDSGLGNHPELVKFCHRIGQALSEDTLVLGGTQSGTKTIADRLWGSN